MASPDELHEHAPVRPVVVPGDREGVRPNGQGDREGDTQDYQTGQDARVRESQGLPAQPCDRAAGLRSSLLNPSRLNPSLLNPSPLGTSGRPPTLEEIVAGRSLTRLTAGNLAPVTLAMAAFDATKRPKARPPGRSLPGLHNGARVEPWLRTLRCPRA